GAGALGAALLLGVAALFARAFLRIAFRVRRRSTLDLAGVVALACLGIAPWIAVLRIVFWTALLGISGLGRARRRLVRIVRVGVGRFLGRSDLVVGAGLARGGRGRAVLVLSLGAAGVLGLTAWRGVAGVFLLGRGVFAAHARRTLGLALTGVLLVVLVAL